MKNKIISSLLISASFFTAHVFANPYQGYQPITSIAALNAMPYIDDMPVKLTGTLGQQVGSEYFQFTDSQGGRAIIEIDEDEQYRFRIRPGSPLSFFGEDERDGGRLEIKLEYVTN